MREFSIQSVDGNFTYKGFNRNLSGADLICVVSVEDSIDVYAVDDFAAVCNDLRNYLNDFVGEYRIIGVFDRNYNFLEE